MMRVKVCGLTRVEDAELAVELGASAVGVIFAPSPRRVDTAQAAQLFATVPAHVQRVGVFVNATLHEIAAAVRACDLAAVQLSGTESSAFAYALRSAMDVQVIKAIHVSAASDIAAHAAYPADAFLLDAPVAAPAGTTSAQLTGVAIWQVRKLASSYYGGTGRVFDWSLAGALPWSRERVIIAGGLCAENLHAAAARVPAAMCDVCSGVEAAPGIKDEAKLRAFFDAARALDEVPC